MVLSSNKADQLTIETVNWDCIMEGDMLQRIESCAQYWAKRYSVDADDLQQEVVLHIAARGREAQPWWVARRMAHDWANEPDDPFDDEELERRLDELQVG